MENLTSEEKGVNSKYAVSHMLDKGGFSHF